MTTDDRPRCAWPGNDPLNLEHHDVEWGVPSRDRRHLFELLTLEGAQAGLSWTTILRKRDGYVEAFAGFEPERVAAFGLDDIDRLMLDAGIIRNRAKIEATIDNARAILALEGQGTRLRRAPVVVRRRARAPERLRRDRHAARGDRRVAGDVEGPEEARLPVRRADDALRVHAVSRAGERPPGVVLPPRGVRRARLSAREG